MKKRSVLKWVLLWILAILVTATALIYQELTGPTNPLRTKLWLNNQEAVKLKLIRSHGGNSDCPVELEIADTSVKAEINYRTYPGDGEWTTIAMVRSGNILAAALPHQPPAGKLEYYIIFRQYGKSIRVPTGEPPIVRFRGDVPAGILVPHIVLMFLAMLFSNLAFVLAAFNFRAYRLYSILTVLILLAGGFIFGPLVQKFAFGQYWTGFPIGFDLTDNKTLIALVFWLLAVIGNLKNDRRILPVLAGLVMLVVFSIPHSIRGSELDRSTGKVTTGSIQLPVSF